MSAPASLLARLWREQRVVLVAFVLALGLTGVFGGRIVVRAVYWASPGHLQQDPEPWMTPAYIARSWQLPNAAVDAIVGFDPAQYDGKRRPSLARIARGRGEPVEALIADLRAALPGLQAQLERADPDAPAADATTPNTPAPDAPTPNAPAPEARP